MDEFWSGRRVFVTGICGTVGREVLRQLLMLPVAEIVGVDSNESELFMLGEAHRSHAKLSLFLGDTRDRDTLTRRMRGIDYVIHAAALKHVILCERSPHDAIFTNIVGTQNLIEAAIANKVSRVLFTSSDKAVNPTNVMGSSKLVGERLIAAADLQSGPDDTVFMSTRFGNVLGSRGSVIPVFRQQIGRGGPLTLTDNRMTRFIMSLPDAVRLVLESIALAHGGEVFVTKMKCIKIEDLAAVMIEELAPAFGYAPANIVIETIGAKAGEKLYEELLTDEEANRAFELDRYFVVTPALRSSHRNYAYERAQRMVPGTVYNSTVQAPVSRAVLADYMRYHNLFRSA